VARKHGFFITYHVLELYGYCRKCFSKTQKTLKKK
jgi:Fe2+ or Zn2+ uptake regulation protein